MFGGIEITAVASLLFGYFAVAVSTEELLLQNTNTSDGCPVWSKSKTNCQCEDFRLRHIIRCRVGKNNVEYLEVQNCYCVWYDRDNNETIVSECSHTCYNTNGTLYYQVERTANYREFNQQMCSGTYLGLELHRNDSRLCGKCSHGYGLAVYSYQFSECILCHDNYYKIGLYIVVAFVPLTVFYLIVITFRISATSGNLNGYIFFCQVITSPVYMRLFVNATKSNHYVHWEHYIKTVYTFYGIWNLDFFRLLYRPFCIQPHLTAQFVLALDYLVALYPLILIILTYIFVVLHERGCKVIVFLWKPFHKFFARFRSQWAIKKSLVHAFSTFIVLSYVKILSVSFDLLLPTYAHRSPSFARAVYFYYDPTILFDGHSAFYFFVAALCTLICVLSPILLLLAYPCRCFQRLMNIKSLTVHIFMDTLIGCYRQEPAYCRGFAGIYFLLRLLTLMIFELTLSLIYISSISAIIMSAAIVFAMARPYKKLSHNVTDVVFLIYLAICFNIQSAVLFSQVYENYHTIFVSVFAVLLSLPVIYPVCIFLGFLYTRSSLMQKISAWYQNGKELVNSTDFVDKSRYGATG